MDEDSSETIREITYQRDQWRTIAIAYLVQCIKAGPGVHERAVKMLNEEQLGLVKDEVAKILK